MLNLTLTAYFCCSWVSFSKKMERIISLKTMCHLVLSVLFSYSNKEQSKRKQAPQRLWFTVKLSGKWLSHRRIPEYIYHHVKWDQDWLLCFRKIFCAWSPLQLIILSLFCLFKEKRKSNTDLTLCCLQKTGKSQMMQNRKDSSFFDLWKFPLFFFHLLTWNDLV